MLVAGSDAPGDHFLPLILPELIQTVRNLEPVSRCEQVQVNNVVRRELVINSIEKTFAIADVVKGEKLGCIKKTAAANAVNREEVPDLIIPPSQTDAAGRRAESAISAVHIAEDFLGVESRAGGDLGDEAGLVAKFSVD